MFKFKSIKDAPERTLGFIARVFGVDISLLLLGWVSDWKLIDLRIPANYGAYLQTLFVVISIGRLPDDTYEAP